MSGQYLQSDVDRSVTGRAVTVNTKMLLTLTRPQQTVDDDVFLRTH